MPRVTLAVLIGLLSMSTTGSGEGIHTQVRGPSVPAGSERTAPSLEVAQHLFYVGRYEEASDMALAIRTTRPDDLATYELRTSALHFMIKRGAGDGLDREEAVKRCLSCPALLAAMTADTAHGQDLARARLKLNEDDQAALFLLGKIDLNHVWLYLGTLGQRTGWTEYWEARHSLDAVLKADPQHVRARVARAWIDYIVDTRVPRGLRWVLGGGSKKKALLTAREAASATTDFYSHTEAGFALWEMLVREKNVPEALGVAEQLSADFPDNPELRRFITTNRPKTN